MVIFGEKISKITVFTDQNAPRMTIVHSQNVLDFDRTPAFYLRGFGNVKLLIF